MFQKKQISNFFLQSVVVFALLAICSSAIAEDKPLLTLGGEVGDSDALKGRMLPALWGNARLLCGLVEAMRAFPEDQETSSAARRLGDFYLSVLPRFNDPKRIEEYTAGGTYAAGYWCFIDIL